MGAPAVVMGDQITGQCPQHLIPNPASGAPQPSPPLPFAAPINQGTVATVLIGGKPAAVVGSSGINATPHIALHPSDPYSVVPMQKGQVVSGSPTVLIGGKPAANGQSTVTCCVTPGTVAPTVTTVLIG